MKKKIVITGASGLLGRRLLHIFKESSWETLGLAFSRAKDDLLRCDLGNKEDFLKVIRNFQPTCILHAAAQRYPDKVDKDYTESVKLNVETSKNIADISAENGLHLLFISTDYVFDGTKPPYGETDATNPVNKYGQTKADAEVAIMSTYPGAVILRVPVLYGDEEFLGESAVSVLLKSVLNTSKNQHVSDYEKRCPSFTDDVAHICVKLFEKKIVDAENIKGIYQWSGQEVLTKYDMVKAMSEEFGLPISHIIPITDASGDVTRPYDTQMSVERLSKLAIGQHTPFRTGIKSFQKFLP